MTTNVLPQKGAQLLEKFERRLLKLGAQEGRALSANLGLTQGGREQ